MSADALHRDLSLCRELLELWGEFAPEPVAVAVVEREAELVRRERVAACVAELARLRSG